MPTTKRVTVVARLVPPAADARSDIVDAGNLEPPSGSLLDVEPVPADVDVSSELRALREGERWCSNSTRRRS